MNFKDVILLERTEVLFQGRLCPAWVCQIEKDIKVISERELKRRKGTRTGPIAASMNRIYYSYKHRCRSKNTFFDLTIFQFEKLSQQNCAYCDKPPSNGGSKLEPFIYNGIDRKDNNKGYTLTNSVPCCAACNQIKSSILSYEEMLAAMKAVLEVRKGLK